MVWHESGHVCEVFLGEVSIESVGCVKQMALSRVGCTFQQAEGEGTAPAWLLNWALSHLLSLDSDWNVSPRALQFAEQIHTFVLLVFVSL